MNMRDQLMEMNIPFEFTSNCEKELALIEKLSMILNRNGLTVFRYTPRPDHLIIFGSDMQPTEQVCDLRKEIETSRNLNEEDRQKMLEFFYGNSAVEAVEIRVQQPGEPAQIKAFDAVLLEECEGEKNVLLGCIKDITIEKGREFHLKDMAKRDSFTGLYNRISGQKMIDGYLQSKPLEESCGIMVIDIDYFKSINDSFGHLFGDKVLLAVTEVLKNVFDESDILMRAGGDEFLILVKDATDEELEKRQPEL